MILYNQLYNIKIIKYFFTKSVLKRNLFLSKWLKNVITTFLFVSESRAMSTYVAEKLKSDMLRTENPKEGALVKTWMEVESQQFSPAVSPIFYQFCIVPMLGGTPNQAIVDENSEKLGKVLDVYEKKLSSTKYLAGDFYSLADLHHLSYIYYLMKTPSAKLINERPHVKAWWEDISSRPASKKVASGLTLGDK